MRRRYVWAALVAGSLCLSPSAWSAFYTSDQILNAVSGCRDTTPNAQGVAGADITIDATAGGVAVLAASDTRCGALITNAGAADMRCADTGTTVTATVGYLVPSGSTLVLGPEGRKAWACIRTGGTSTTASVVESVP